MIVGGGNVVLGDKGLGRGSLARLVIFVALDATLAVVKLGVGGCAILCLRA